MNNASSHNEPSSPRRLRVAQIGCGAWGTNVLRELAAHPRVEVVLVADPRPAAMDRAKDLAPAARIAPSIAQTDVDGADAAVIVTPGPLHAEHAELALRRGLHVFVEKPMTTSSADAERLESLARQQGLTGMVGHLLHHHPAAVAMLDVLRSGELGAPLRVRCDRASITGSRDVDGSVFWSLAPHDLSLVRAIDPSPLEVVRVDVLRTSPGGSALEAEVTLRTLHGLSVRVSLSRVADRKARRMHVECEDGLVIFDDVAQAAKVVVAKRGEHRMEPVAYDQRVTPLAAEVDAFVRAVLDGVEAHADFREGADVVRVIEAAERMGRAPVVEPAGAVGLSAL